MNWEKFNHRLRKDAEGQNDDVDIDGIWSAIEPQVDEINTEKKKKRRGVFFWWGAGILLLSVGVWFLGNQFSQKETMVQKIDNQTITTKKPHTNTNTTEANNTAVNASTKPTKEVDLGKNKLQTETVTAKDYCSKSNFFKNKNQTKTNQSNSKPPQSPESNDLINNKSAENTSAAVATISTDEDLDLPGSRAAKDEVRAKEKIMNIASLIRLLDFSTEKISLENEKKFWTPTIKYPPKKRSRFSIGVYGGANFTHRTLAEKREESGTLLQNRETYETPLETSQVGVNLSYKVLNKEKYNLEITTGLQLTTITERYKNYQSTESTSDVFGVQYLSYGIGTEPVEIMGWVTQTKTTEYRKKIYNTYRMIDIPLLIGYNRSVGKKWQVGIQGGIFANLSLAAEGIIPNADLNDINLAQGDGVNIFKSNVGLSYHLGFNIKRELSKHWELNISPSARYFGNDFANDDYGLSQKYMLFGGNVGVNYRF